MNNHIKYISCQEMEVMVSIEGTIIEKHAFYFPSVGLVYIKKGALHCEVDGTTTIIERGNFALINKHTHGMMHKSWSAEEQEANLYLFMLRDEFIEKVRQSITNSKAVDTSKVNDVHPLQPNPILSGLFDSIINYIQEEQEVDTQLMELKTLEALLGILKFHPECYKIFSKEQNAQKANLQLFIESNYMINVPLSKLASISGRSLSTFNREFKSIYRESPHRWIRKRRLIKAKELLLNTNRRPVEFYLELGFESLAHFSRAFKKEFGQTLTDFRKSHHSKIN